MRRMLLLLFVVLLTAAARAEGAAVTEYPPTDFARALYGALGEEGILSEEVRRDCIERGRAPEGTDFSRYRVIDMFMIAISEGEEPDADVFVSIPVEPEIMLTSKLFGVVCALDGGLNWTTVSSVLNRDGNINVFFTAAQADLVRGAEASVFFLMCDPMLDTSPLYREIGFGTTSLDVYYKSPARDFSLFGSGDRAKRMTAKRYFAAWDALAEGHGDAVTRTELGLSSDGKTTCVSYTLMPASGAANGPKLIVVSGQHGYEKVAPFGLYYFARDLLEHWQDDPALGYIHENVTLVLLPCMNPYGFDNYVRVNANGVDLNRNYDVDFATGTGETSGPAAFSEPETRMVRDVIEANADALCVIDFHNYGNYNIAPDSMKCCNWHSHTFVVRSDPFGAVMYEASKRQIEEVTESLIEDYGQPETAAPFGTITINANPDACMLRNWAIENGMMAMTFEALGGFPDDAAPVASYRAQKANAELIGNWIRNVLKAYARWE
ncbi:MAG: DUF2817 domain-containing protein [Clostridiales bacterium]|nr:DUF2817 domain-containing protein [Clostridiales bacterium]